MNESRFALINTTKTTLGPASLIQYLHGQGLRADYIYAPKHGDALYGERELGLLVCESGRYAIVGISSFTISESRAFQLAAAIKAAYPHVHLALGGPNVIMDPERILHESAADSVCIHEGEIPLTKLILDPALANTGRVPGLLFKNGNKTLVNPCAEVVRDLDQIPLENYKKSRYGSYKRLAGSGFERESTLAERIDNPCMPKSFIYMLTTRGCPFSCSYCINSTLHDIEAQTHCPQVRRMSIGHTLTQLQKVMANDRGIGGVFFFDDDFSLRSEKELAEFSRRYREAVSLPFYVFANPNTTSDSKLDAYAHAGLKSIELGVQTVSERVLTEYNRPQNAEHLRRILNCVATNAYQFEVSFDIITNSPFESPDDVVQTIEYILGLPGDFQLYVHNLHLFPGSPLRNKYGKGTGNEFHEYQDNYSANPPQYFNEFYTKILFAMQGWHKVCRPEQFGQLTRKEIESMLLCPVGKQAEWLSMLERKISQTPVAKFYRELHNW